MALPPTSQVYTLSSSSSSSPPLPPLSLIRLRFSQHSLQAPSSQLPTSRISAPPAGFGFGTPDSLVSSSVPTGSGFVGSVVLLHHDVLCSGGGSGRLSRLRLSRSSKTLL